MKPRATNPPSIKPVKARRHFRMKVSRPFRHIRKRETPPPRLDEIFVIVDFSEPSRQALKFAISLAQMSYARLTLLHVMNIALDAFELRPEETHRLEERALTVARRKLEKILVEEVQNKVTAATLLCTEPASAKISEITRHSRASLLVTGTSSRPSQQWMGCAAEIAIRSAACPVLVVPEDVTKKTTPERSSRSGL